MLLKRIAFYALIIAQFSVFFKSRGEKARSVSPKQKTDREGRFLF